MKFVLNSVALTLLLTLSFLMATIAQNGWVVQTSYYSPTCEPTSMKLFTSRPMNKCLSFDSGSNWLWYNCTDGVPTLFACFDAQCTDCQNRGGDATCRGVGSTYFCSDVPNPFPVRSLLTYQ